MPGLMLALALAAQAAPAMVHEYKSVMISPAGDKVAALESDDLAGSEAEAHPTLVVRSRADGKVLATYDPCPTCVYGAAAWSPDGASLAFVASNRKAKTAT